MNFNNQLKDYYGFDKFSAFLLILSIIFYISRWTAFLGLLLVGFVVYRYFSKDKYKRHLEEMAYEQQIAKIKYKLSELKNKLHKDRHSIIVKCPSCGQRLRLPKGKGKIIARCKICGNEFKIIT